MLLFLILPCGSVKQIIILKLYLENGLSKTYQLGTETIHTGRFKFLCIILRCIQGLEYTVNVILLLYCWVKVKQRTVICDYKFSWWKCNLDIVIFRTIWSLVVVYWVFYYFIKDLLRSDWKLLLGIIELVVRVDGKMRSIYWVLRT